MRPTRPSPQRRSLPRHAVEHVQNIAEVFARNGHEFDEYT